MLRDSRGVPLLSELSTNEKFVVSYLYGSSWCIKNPWAYLLRVPLSINTLP